MTAQLLGWIATALFTLCYIPQMVKMLRDRSVRGVSGLFLFIPIVANCIALAYAIEIGQQPLVLKYMLGITFSSVCFAVWYFMDLIGYDGEPRT